MTEFKASHFFIDSDFSMEQDRVTVYDSKLPLFKGPHNPNHDIFVVETQEGADKDDQGHGSIGDATMEHISKMRHRLLEMEHYVHMPNGNLFRVEHNVQDSDEIGEKFIKNQIMQVLTSNDRRVSAEDKKRLIAFLKEEIEERRRQKEEKQDAMDQILIPYDEWEAMPQLTSSWDIPPTPRPLYIYAGTTRQMFYDVFPEGHPDEDKINAFIMMVNSIDWDDFDDNTIEYFQKWLGSQRWTIQTCIDHLLEFCIKVASDVITGLPDDHMEAALLKIDEDWAAGLRNRAIRKFNNCPIMKEIREFENKLRRRPAGTLMWAEIGKFGQYLYKKYGREVTTAHWNAYRELKAKFAPEVRIGNLDVNTASVYDLMKHFMKRTNRNDAYNRARKIFFMRPFMSLEDLAKLRLITPEDIGYTERNVVFITLIKKARKQCLEQGTTSHLAKLSQLIIAKQREKPELMTQEEWSAVWQAYRISKASLGC